jgi:hypothetical protein
MLSGGGIQDPCADGSGDVPDVLAIEAETELRDAINEEDGEVARTSSAQVVGFGPSVGGWAAGLPRMLEEIEEMDGREDRDGREVLVATLAVRLPREGRLFCSSLACASRRALPWMRQFMLSISLCTGSWTSW